MGGFQLEVKYETPVQLFSYNRNSRTQESLKIKNIHSTKIALESFI